MAVLVSCVMSNGLSQRDAREMGDEQRDSDGDGDSDGNGNGNGNWCGDGDGDWCWAGWRARVDWGMGGVGKGVMCVFRMADEREDGRDRNGPRWGRSCA